MKVIVPIALMVIAWIVFMLLISNSDSPRPGSMPSEPPPDRIGREWD